MGMGLAEAVADLSGHESGHLQNSARQQVNLSIHLLHMFIDNSVYGDASIQNASGWGGGVPFWLEKCVQSMNSIQFDCSQMFGI